MGIKPNTTATPISISVTPTIPATATNHTLLKLNGPFATVPLYLTKITK